MPSVAELLRRPEVASRLELLAGDADRDVRGVRLAEDLSAVGEAPGDSLVLLSSQASQEVATYRLDVAVRRASANGIAALVLMSPELDELSATAVAIAERGRVALLRARGVMDLAETAVSVAREAAGGSDLALARIEAVHEALVESEQRMSSLAELVSAASAAFGEDIVVEGTDSMPAEDDLGLPLIVDAQETGRVRIVGDPARGSERASRIVLALVADAVGRVVTRAQRERELPTRSREELLGELLQGPSPESTELVQRARSLGILIDGWHLAAQIEFDNLLVLSGDDEAHALELSQSLARTSIETARGTASATWESARLGHSVILVRMDRRDPGPRVGAQMTAVLDRVIQRLRARVSTVSIYCGFGSAHPGFAGLKASLAEGRAALAAARTAATANCPVGFDTVGLRRMLIEWYASDTAREAVESILAPLDRLGAGRCEEAIRTLSAYLDNQGSLAKSAEVLHLHRNSVAYRIRRIFDVLDADPDDPDQRLILQLSCRARLLRS